MPKVFAFILLICVSLSCVYAQEPKLISDCTIVYDVTVTDSKADPLVVKSMSGSTKIVYIKGTKSRSDLVTPTFTQTTLYDSKTDSTVILRELGNNKYITYLSDQKRREQKDKYDGMGITNTNEKKTILGYDCREVVAKLPNGSTYNIFYTPAVTPSNKLYEYQFKDVPGLVLEYEGESEDGKTRIKYSATKINLAPVPNAKFDLPRVGYRVL